MITIQYRHLDVHEYEGWDRILFLLFRRETRRRSFEKIFQCFSSIPNCAGGEPKSLDKLERNLLVDWIV
jgi:hypothetical protein